MNVLETYSAEEIVEQTFSLARGDYTQELQRLPKAALPNECKNKHGDTLLMLAAYNGHKETTQLLLDINRHCYHVFISQAYFKVQHDNHIPKSLTKNKQETTF